MKSPAVPSVRIPVRVSDYFLLAMDQFMRRTGQGQHLSQSVLELAARPDLNRLREVAARLTQKHPLLFARLRREWLSRLAYWESPSPEQRPPLPLDLWSENGDDAIADAEEFLQDRVNEPLASDFNARLDVVERRDGRFLVALTWSHRVLDGKGAELLLAEIARLCDGIDEPAETKPQTPPALSWPEKIARTKKAVIRFDKMAALAVHSLGGPKPHPGQGRYQMITLDEEDSTLVRERAARTTGELFPLPYYLACAARAHAAVFERRGKMPKCLVPGVPIQTRKRGARGPLFHNQVTVFFFLVLQEEMRSLESAALALKKDFAEMTREKLDESFNAILEMMVRVPSWLFMKIVRWQFKGELNTFYYSHTGTFAPELTTFAGAEILNAWHLPCLGSPPGTGIFFNERNDRITITLSWREGCLSTEERQVMLARLLEDLLGTKKPILDYAL